MTQSKEKAFTNTESANDFIVLDLQEFDLGRLDLIKGTALGNILEKNISSSSNAHSQHTSHSSHEVHQTALW